jgi:hypothetical protein
MSKENVHSYFKIQNDILIHNKIEKAKNTIPDHDSMLLHSNYENTLKQDLRVQQQSTEYNPNPKQQPYIIKPPNQREIPITLIKSKVKPLGNNSTSTSILGKSLNIYNKNHITINTSKTVKENKNPIDVFGNSNEIQKINESIIRPKLIVPSNTHMKKNISCSVADDDNDEDDNNERFPDTNGLAPKTSVFKNGSVKVPQQSSVFSFGALEYVNRLSNKQQNVDLKLRNMKESVSNRAISSIGRTGMNSHDVLSTSYASNSLLSNNKNHRSNPILYKPNQPNLITQRINNKNNNKRMIGNIMIDEKKLNQNSNSGIKKQKTNTQIDIIKRKKDELIDKEIESLLSRKSTHAKDAEDDWFDSYGKKLDKLAKREFMVNKESSIHSIDIDGFYCVQCKILSETFLGLCKSNGHVINKGIIYYIMFYYYYILLIYILLI